MSDRIEEKRLIWNPDPLWQEEIMGPLKAGLAKMNADEWNALDVEVTDSNLGIALLWDRDSSVVIGEFSAEQLTNRLTEQLRIGPPGHLLCEPLDDYDRSCCTILWKPHRRTPTYKTRPKEFRWVQLWVTDGKGRFVQFGGRFATQQPPAQLGPELSSAASNASGDHSNLRVPQATSENTEQSTFFSVVMDDTTGGSGSSEDPK